MIARRPLLFGVLAAGLARTGMARAQPIAVPAVGWLKIQDRDQPGWLPALRRGLATQGRQDGRDFRIVERHADGDPARLPALAAELVGAGAAVIVATSQPAVDAARRVAAGLPIVGRMTDDPVAAGAAASLARPGSNLTGIYSQLDELSGKRLALLCQAAPSMRRVGVLLDPGRGATAHWLAAAATAARPLGVALHEMPVRGRDDLAPAFRDAVAAGVAGVMGFRNPTLVTHFRDVVDLTRLHRLPSIFDARETAEAGALLAYGPDLDALFERLAFHVDRILRGEPAGALAIEQPTRLELAVNAGTARSLGLALSPDLLAAADVVIE